MKFQYVIRTILVFMFSILLFTVAGSVPEQDGKIPITTSSDEALKSFLKGRDLFDRLQATKSIQYFESAVATDPNFALAYLNLSFVVPSAKEFFDNLSKALALVNKVSEGEQFYILGVQAAVNGFPMKQREYYKKMIKMYPKDERAYNLLGGHYFGQQEYALAVESYKKATEIAPDFSQPYNQLGYAYRFLEKYDKAEKAFKKYIELIPDDPNPYDSYAELLMKTGKFEESITHYKKALSIDPNFVASHIGIATDLNFLERHEEAREQLKKLLDIARNEGEKRAAYFAMAVSYVDEGEMELALKELKKQYASNEKINDEAAMAGNLVVMGNLLLESGHADKAMSRFEKAMQVVQKSGLSDEVKANNKRAFLFNTARVAIKQNDMTTAKAKAKEFQSEVKALDNPIQNRLVHQLYGMIALAEKDYRKAIAELKQANQQNPYNLYRLAQAYKGMGETDKQKEICKKAADFNALNNMNYAFIRTKVKKMATIM